ncbi:hypothetical protein BV20DRAFT_952158 [Pilatotrama ljubarskyi]|nr:hypothetical protein BV20DRAFT_952158 [Pilatotrama ljubarskyi]
MPSYAASSQCNTGSVHCCNDVQPSSSDSVAPLLGALNIPLDLSGSSNVGLDCTPINLSSAGGSQSCTAMPVCCNGNNYGGITLGCMPIPVIM